MDLNSIKQNSNPIIYSFIVSLGIVFLPTVYWTNTDYFWVGAGISYLLLLLSIFLIYKKSKKKLNQLGLPQAENYETVTKYIYHFLIPSIGFWSFTGFVFTNVRLNQGLLFFLISFFVFTSLFINIRAYYLDKFKLEENTHYVYDLIKIISYFNIITTILSMGSRYDLSFYAVAGLIFVVGSLLSLLLILRKTFVEVIHILIILLAGLALGYLTASINVFMEVNNIVVAFFSTLIFYLLNAIIHHEIDKTLRVSTLIEYILVAIICFLVILLFI